MQVHVIVKDQQRASFYHISNSVSVQVRPRGEPIKFETSSPLGPKGLPVALIFEL